MEKKEKHEKNLEKFYTASIALDNDRWLMFERVVDYDIFDEDAVEIKLFDRSLQTTTLLGTWFDGRWSVPLESNGKILWELLKDHKTTVKKVMRNLRTPVGDFGNFTLEWNCVTRRFRLQSIKIKRKIKHFEL